MLGWGDCGLKCFEQRMIGHAANIMHRDALQVKSMLSISVDAGASVPTHCNAF